MDMAAIASPVDEATRFALDPTYMTKEQEIAFLADVEKSFRDAINIPVTEELSADMETAIAFTTEQSYLVHSQQKKVARRIGGKLAKFALQYQIKKETTGLYFRKGSLPSFRLGGGGEGVPAPGHTMISVAFLVSVSFLQ